MKEPLLVFSRERKLVKTPSTYCRRADVGQRCQRLGKPRVFLMIGWNGRQRAGGRDGDGRGTKQPESLGSPMTALMGTVMAGPQRRSMAACQGAISVLFAILMLEVETLGCWSQTQV